MNFFSKSGVSRIVLYDTDLKASDLVRTGEQFRSLGSHLESRVAIILSEIDDLSIHSLALLLSFLKSLSEGHSVTLVCSPTLAESLRYAGLHELAAIDSIAAGR